MSFLASRMPESDSAGAAVSASAFCCSPANRTDKWVLLRTGSKVFIVENAMTTNAESGPVIRVKTQIGIISKALDMMGVKLSRFSAFLTGKMVALINGGSPFR